MKKKVWDHASGGLFPDAFKILLKMKLTLSIILLSIFGAIASESYSQSKKISLDLKNETVENVLGTIEAKSDFYFLYSAELINVNRKVDINVKENTIEQILEQLFAGTNINYAVKNRQIVLSANGVASTSQQPRSISGKVTDSSGTSLPGVSIVVKGTTTGVITDMDGKYSLAKVPENATLQFSFVGMKTQEIAVGSKTTINVTLAEEAIGLDEVVAVGYGTQRKGNLTGSISSVKSEQLVVAPIANVTNALAGQVMGLVAKQLTGEPGNDAAQLSIRGFGSPLVIVDGIEAKLTNLDASQIESVSVLKDGAASIYGARAGNGVILVTTKRGQNQKPTISINSSLTMQGTTKIISPASSGQRAEYDREKYINAGNPAATAPFSLEDIRKYYDGTDPNYQNNDWYSETMRPWAPESNTNVSVRGGSERIKYYGFMGYTNQETIVRKNGGNYNRYNIQSNIDASLTDNLTLTLDIALANEKRYFPYLGYDSEGNLWWQIYTSQPRLPYSLPDPSKLAYGGISYGNMLYVTNTDLLGYDDNTNKQVRTSAALTYEFKKVKGLKAKAQINHIENHIYQKRFVKQEKFYEYNPVSDLYTYARSSQDPTALYEYMVNRNSLDQQYSLTYDNIFNKIHHFSLLALYESTDYNGHNFNASRSGFFTSVLDQMFAGNPSTSANGGSADEMGRVSWVGRLNYSYMDRFLVETIFRADASAKFSKKNQWGYFPSVSMGWVMSEERFIKSLGFVDNLKLRASYGQSGDDAVLNYQYLSGYKFDGAYQMGDAVQSGLASTGLANPILTWEQMTIYNLGFDFSVLNRKIYGSSEAFYRLRDGIPGTRSSSLPSTFGATLPQENLNSIGHHGFELSLGTAGKNRDFSYDLSGNLSYTVSKWVKFDEPEFTDPDQQRLYQKSGQFTDRQIGYVSDGLFTSQDEIDNLPYTYKDLGGNSTLRPGDVKYLDLNGDKVFDWRDQKQIGSGSLPHWMFGINTIVRYRNFDMTVLFQGAFGYSTKIVMQPVTSVGVENRWQETTNNPNALVPRPGGAPTNTYLSDYYLHNTSYLRLKTASVGYELPEQLLKKARISKLRIYLAGTNLFAISSIAKYGFDPEMNDAKVKNAAGVPTVGYYPLQRTISLGMNLIF